MAIIVFGVAVPLLIVSIITQSSSEIAVGPPMRSSCARKVDIPQIWKRPCWYSLRNVESGFLGQSFDIDGSRKYIVRYGNGEAGVFDLQTGKVGNLPHFQAYDPAIHTRGEILYLPPGAIDTVPYMTDSDTITESPIPNALVISSRKDPLTGEAYDQRLLCKSLPGYGEDAFYPLGVTQLEWGLQYCLLRNRKTKRIHKQDRMEIVVNRYYAGLPDVKAKDFLRCPLIPEPPRPKVCDFLEMVYEGAEKALSSSSVSSAKLRTVLENLISVAHTAWT